MSDFGTAVVITIAAATTLLLAWLNGTRRNWNNLDAEESELKPLLGVVHPEAEDGKEEN